MDIRRLVLVVVFGHLAGSASPRPALNLTASASAPVSATASTPTAATPTASTPAAAFVPVAATAPAVVPATAAAVVPATASAASAASLSSADGVQPGAPPRPHPLDQELQLSSECNVSYYSLGVMNECYGRTPSSGCCSYVLPMIDIDYCVCLVAEESGLKDLAVTSLSLFDMYLTCGGQRKARDNIPSQCDDYSTSHTNPPSPPSPPSPTVSTVVVDSSRGLKLSARDHDVEVSLDVGVWCVVALALAATGLGAYHIWSTRHAQRAQAREDAQRAEAQRAAVLRALRIRPPADQTNPPSEILEVPEENSARDPRLPPSEILEVHEDNTATHHRSTGVAKTGTTASRDVEGGAFSSWCSVM